MTLKVAFHPYLKRFKPKSKSDKLKDHAYYVRHRAKILARKHARERQDGIQGSYKRRSGKAIHGKSPLHSWAAKVFGKDSLITKHLFSKSNTTVPFGKAPKGFRIRHKRTE